MANTNVQNAMSSLTRLAIPERGKLLVDRDTWQKLDTHPEFARLLNAQVLIKTESQDRTVWLAGRGYVGCAFIGDVCIDIVEKVPGLLERLLVGLTSDAFKIAQLPSPASVNGTCVILLVQQFLEALRRDVSLAMDVAYTRTVRISNQFIGGPINVRQTIAARTHGRPHHVAFNQSKISLTTPKNKVLYAALREVDQLQHLMPLPLSDRVTIPAYLDLFAGAVESELWWTTLGDACKTAAELLADSSRQDRDLLLLAQVILEHVSFDRSSTTEEQTPRAWFLKLELLFQGAVLRILQKCYQPILLTRTARLTERPIFSQVLDRYRAQPDLVLEVNTFVRAIGDVKYKVWEDDPDEHDLYQLLVHASAYDAKCAFLVYPHDRWVMRDLGVAATGCRTWIVGIDIINMEAGLKAALEAMGVFDDV